MKSKIFYGWWIVLSSAFVLVVLGPACVAVANLFQTPVTAEFGISNSQFAISNSIVMGVGIFLSPYISKKFATGNFRLVFVTGVLIYGLAYMGFGAAPNIIVFYILSLFVGFGFMSTTVLPVGMLVNNWFIQKRGLALSLSLTGLGVGGVFFSQILTPLIANVGWRQTYFIYGAIMLLVGLPIGWFVFRGRPEELQMKAYGFEEMAPSAAPEKERGESKKTAKAFSMRTPAFILLMLGAVMVGLSNNGGLGQFPPVLTSLHGPSQAALVISTYSAVGILGKIALGNVNDRFGINVSTIYAAVLIILAYVMMIFATDYIFAILMAIFFGMGNAIGTVAPPLITAAIYDADEFPIAYGYLQSALKIGMTVGSLFAAAIADLTGTYTATWIAMAAASAIFALAWVGAYRYAPKNN